MNTQSQLRISLLLALGALTLGACADSPDTGGGGDVVEPAQEVPVAEEGELAFSLRAPQQIAVAKAAVNVDVTVTNTAAHPVRVLRYLTPLDGIKEDLFSVAFDGAAVEYLGRHYKWAQPEATDYLTLGAGESVSVTVDLATAYDFGETGRYSVAYGGGHHGDEAAHVASSGITVEVEGRAFAVPGAELGSQLTTTGCSSSRITALTQAYAASRTMAASALAYLTNTTPSATTRYTTWFGAFTASRWSTARSHFSAISQRLSNEVADCTCTDSAYAYVYPGQPYKIYLCNAFWNAPLTGTDSRAGTLIHEMSHFNVVAGTNDNAYGQSACRNLARTSPTRALDNADSHEYFAENTPFQN